MLTDLKLSVLLELYIWKKHFENKANKMWYCKYLPQNIAQAFTLAEVLITLLIIGVVASLVIPALINDTQNAELKTAWKKEYAVVAQSFQRILTDNAGTLKGVCPSAGWEEDSKCIMNTFRYYLNTNKYCPTTSETVDTCWHSWNPATVHNLNGTDQIFWSSHYPAMILTDGTLLSFQGGTAVCSLSDGVGATNECVFIILDVNGFKRPNMLGKDIFAIHVFENKISPFGTNDNVANDCNTSPPSGQGFGCSAKYLAQ